MKQKLIRTFFASREKLIDRAIDFTSENCIEESANVDQRQHY